MCICGAFVVSNKTCLSLALCLGMPWTISNPGGRLLQIASVLGEYEDGLSPARVRAPR